MKILKRKKSGQKFDWRGAQPYHKQVFRHCLGAHHVQRCLSGGLRLGGIKFKIYEVIVDSSTHKVSEIQSGILWHVHCPALQWPL